jgi:hypothetical protein
MPALPAERSGFQGADDDVEGLGQREQELQLELEASSCSLKLAAELGQSLLRQNEELLGERCAAPPPPPAHHRG